MKRVVRFAFWMRVVVILLAADRLLLFHLDAGEFVYDPFDVERLLPRNDKHGVRAASRILMLDRLNRGLNPERSWPFS